MNTYELQVRAICPLHATLTDFYAVTIRTSALIDVETILSFFKRYQTEQVFQEELTQRAAVALGAQVETIGIHSGVKVTCVAP